MNLRPNKASRKNHINEQESGFMSAGEAFPVNAAGPPDPAAELEEFELDSDADAAGPDDSFAAAAASLPIKDAGTTMPAAPGVSVCPPITYAPAALGVMVSEPMVRRGREAVGYWGIVLVPITSCVAEVPRLRRVPETVNAGPPGVRLSLDAVTPIAGAPGVRVWPAIT